jgi:NADH-ubiquinone oxidoreductase chain 6
MINIRLVDILETGYQYTKNLPLAIFVGTLFIFIIFSTLPFTFNNVYLLSLPLDLLLLLNNLFMENFGFTASSELSQDFFRDQIFNTVQFNSFTDVITQNLIQIKILGQGLYSYGAICLLLSSIILLLAMLSAIILSK